MTCTDFYGTCWDFYGLIIQLQSFPCSIIVLVTIKINRHTSILAQTLNLNSSMLGYFVLSRSKVPSPSAVTVSNYYSAPNPKHFSPVK